MDGPRKIFLAGSGFAKDGHRHLGSGEAKRALCKTLHCRVRTGNSSQSAQVSAHGLARPDRGGLGRNRVPEKGATVFQSQHPFLGWPAAHQVGQIVHRNFEKVLDVLPDQAAAPVRGKRLGPFGQADDPPGPIQSNRRLRVNVQELRRGRETQHPVPATACHEVCHLDTPCRGRHQRQGKVLAGLWAW